MTRTATATAVINSFLIVRDPLVDRFRLQRRSPAEKVRNPNNLLTTARQQPRDTETPALSRFFTFFVRSLLTRPGIAESASNLDLMPVAVVTGGAGFLGSHLCDYLLEQGHSVVCLDNLDTG